MAARMDVFPHRLFREVLRHQLRSERIQLGHVDVALGDVRTGIADRHLVVFDGAPQSPHEQSVPDESWGTSFLCTGLDFD